MPCENRQEVNNQKGPVEGPVPEYPECHGKHLFLERANNERTFENVLLLSRTSHNLQPTNEQSCTTKGLLEVFGDV